MLKECLADVFNAVFYIVERNITENSRYIRCVYDAKYQLNFAVVPIYALLHYSCFNLNIGLIYQFFC